MIPRDLLLRRPVPYVGAPPASVDQAIDGAVNQLFRHKLRVPRSTDVIYPRAAELASVKAVMAKHHGLLGDHGVAMLHGLLVRPLRVYELEQSTGDMRHVVLVTSLTAEGWEDPRVVFGDLIVPRSKGGWSQSAFEVTVMHASDEAVTTRLEDIASAVIGGQRYLADPDLPNPPRVLWLGGSRDELPGDPNWLRQLEGVAGARGFLLEVLQQPARHHAEVMQKINSFSGEAVMIWTPFTAGKEYAFSSGVNRGRVEFIEARSLADAVDALRHHLDALNEQESTDVERVLPVDGEIRFYKKHYARRGGGDKMIQRGDCGHNNWTAHTYAPQALRGIEKLESGKPIAKLQKCLSCTGGGVWRVTF